MESPAVNGSEMVMLLSKSISSADHPPEGAGHYVKMVHNGIEYGDMQLIAEVGLQPKESLHPANMTGLRHHEGWLGDDTQGNGRCLHSME